MARESVESVQVCILVSSPTNRLFSELPTDYAGEHNARNAEKWGLSWLRQRNFVIFRYISTKLGDKMYI